ncbi:hypothetical protein [Fictibacillus fluitans]|uniref:Uncharacterized protein n=1 Tax=Fictibacillus fluitans TaxID=3058422 RepID=A0ABT8HT35_9BACL|nr:hypothetical protein [Fictibacillus sp. NE201]MDN4523906.1 hypothetical protein [Fictibacillus sp. NE201]
MKKKRKSKRSSSSSSHCSLARGEVCGSIEHRPVLPAVGIPGTPGAPGQPGPPGFSSDHAFIYNLITQALTAEEDILFDSNGVNFGTITHTPGTAEIVINDPGDYYISFSVTGDINNQFGLFNGGILVPGTIYGSDDVNQQNLGQTILTIDTVPATLTVRYHTNVVPLTVTLQTPAGGTQTNDTASVFIQKLGMQTTATVGTSADLLVALNDNTISRIILTPGTYDISASAFVRTNAVRLISTAATTVIFNTNQAFNFITIGENIDPQALRIQNIRTRNTYANIRAAIDDPLTQDGDTIELSPGTYTEPVTPASPLLINKQITLRGISAQLTEVNFTTPPSNTSYMVISADNVTVENIHFIGPVGTTDNALLSVRLKSSSPFEQYTNDIIRYNILEGGRYSSLLDVENFQYIGNTVLYNGNTYALVLQTINNGLFLGNVLNGNVNAGRAFSIEGSLATGTLQFSNNSIFSFQQGWLLNTRTVAPLSFIVTENYMDHRDARSGSTVIFDMYLGGVQFDSFREILIEGNTFIQPKPNRLAVFIDYRNGGTSTPVEKQIKVYNNFFRYAEPWGVLGRDELYPGFPVGYSTPAPAGMSIAVFDMIGNQNF